MLSLVDQKADQLCADDLVTSHDWQFDGLGQLKG